MRVVCDAFAAKRFDVVVRLCYRTRPDLVHWSIADPALDGQNDRATLPAFERLATDLESRVGFLLRQIEDTRNRRSTNAER
jgi:ArsR family transcriptional regulator, arsenate/arsenite/antimonite-responsive transcriptional repressor / arsenate reductase (thioredoxin)